MMMNYEEEPTPPTGGGVSNNGGGGNEGGGEWIHDWDYKRILPEKGKTWNVLTPRVQKWQGTA